MFPSATIYNAVNMIFANAKFFGDSFQFSITMLIILSYPKNVLFSQFSSSGSFAFRMSAFLHRIVNIISLSSREKMVDIYTWANIAFMKYLNSFRNFSIRMFPYETMGKKMFSSNIKSSVSNFIFASRPQKTTRFGTLYKAPEPHYCVSVKSYFPHGSIIT